MYIIYEYGDHESRRQIQGQAWKRKRPDRIVLVLPLCPRGLMVSFRIRARQEEILKANCHRLKTRKKKKNILLGTIFVHTEIERKPVDVAYIIPNTLSNSYQSIVFIHPKFV